jgi:hypothetical protein
MLILEASNTNIIRYQSQDVIYPVLKGSGFDKRWGVLYPVLKGSGFDKRWGVLYPVLKGSGFVKQW